MKKKVIIFTSIVLIVGLFLIFGLTKAPEDLSRASITGNVVVENIDSLNKEPISKESSFFEFEGFGPGKSHIGTFKEMNGNLYLNDNEEIIGFEGTIDASSVDVEIDMLNNHLKTDDFFDVEKYPEINFKSIKIEDSQLTGDLTFRGITKQVTFPVEVSENKISANFALDITPFNIKYIGIDDEVRIAFEFSK